MAKLLSMLTGVPAAPCCTPCGGRCCQRYPGGIYPEDVVRVSGDLRAGVLARLKTTQWVLDCWEGDTEPGGELGQVLYLRPANLGRPWRRPDWPLDRSFGGTCVLWSKESGCSLTFEERPTGCRELVPNPAVLTDSNAGCDSARASDGQNEKFRACVAWRQHQSLLTEILRELEASDGTQDDGA